MSQPEHDSIEYDDIERDDAEQDVENSVAILSMACRFPGASDLEQFWANLKNGVESITFFSDEELAAAGHDPELFRRPNYVKANPTIDGVELFDAAFFDMPPREAEILDPQSRLFLECSWQALESAGYVSEDYDGWIGVFAGTSFSTYQMINLQSRPDVLAAHGVFPIYLANDRDYFTTRVSYKLNLKGPSLNIQTACSTSLVAIHEACQNLFDHQCSIAIAGGVRIGVPQVAGYPYEPGGITSPDGHCRSFDARAQGSLFGNGVGVVVLKRLADALADGDPIAAVIRGTAINNDGSAKVGFTAPSIDGQAEVIAMAQSMAGLDVETLTYVETHGSGTELGDPIEIAALNEAFRSATDAKGFCAIGSVKSNFGHLEAAAGVAGLIKTVLALKHRQIPPTLHFEQPNPQLELDDSPFFVASELMPWESNGAPLRAGVSSFGMGGTNAHVILEEAPAREPSGASRRWQLLLLSARTPTALETSVRELAAWLEASPDAELADVAYPLDVGRRAFEHRCMLVCRDRDDAAGALAARDPARLLSMRPAVTERPVAFLLPGLGEHYADMGLGLYQQEAVFRDQVDRCCRLLEPRLGVDLRELIYPRGLSAPEPEPRPGKVGLDLARMLGRGSRQLDDTDQRLNQTRFAQPAVFVVELALARLWMSWGIQPQALLGHSLGEYVAAVLAGVFTLEDALELVAERARLIDRLPAGSMLAVPLPETDVLPLLGEELSLSAVNAPEVSVVAGPQAAVAALAARLDGDGVACRQLPTTHAFHSSMMEPVAEALIERIRGLPLRPPKIPFISNVTGTWITAEEATDPAYWAEHLCRPVRFSDGVAEVLGQGEGGSPVLLEVGPGQGLGALVLQHSLSTAPRRGADETSPETPGAGAPPGEAEEQRVVVPSLRSSFDPQSDQAFALGALGRLWLAGVRVDWTGFWEGERRHRLELPTYPFERQRFWIDPGRPRMTARESTADVRSPASGQTPAEAGEPAMTLHSRPNLATPYEAPRNPLETTIAEVWQEVLGIASIGVHDSYFDMGGHSLLAPRLLLRLDQALDVSLPLEVLLEHPTVARLGAMIERARAEGEAVLTETAAIDLAAEVTLDEQIRPSGPPAAAVPAAILISGGTGFLGAHLLRELCDQTEARLVCLARAGDAAAARDRLRRNLERHRVWRPEMAERLEPLAGDLSKPRWGLSEDAFTELAGRVGAVYHAGAWVNFTYPYRVLAPSNVEGTREALRLAATGATKPFHFVSSTAVFTPQALESGVGLEDDPLAHTEGLFSGYAETKWVCEKILGIARERGIPVTIYRPGVISGHSRTGAGNTSDMVWNILKGCLQLGATTRRMPVLDVAPVDYVARAIVHLSLREGSAGEVFQFANPSPMPWQEIFEVAESMGYAVRRLPYPEWRRQLGEVADAGADNALIPFLPLFGEVPVGEGGELAGDDEQRVPNVRYDDRNTRSALSGSPVSCPPLDAGLVRTYLDFFIADGFLEPPPQT